MNNLIDGRAIAADIHQETLVRVSTLKHRGVQPGLAFIRVGEDPASQVYVGMKEKKARELGIQSHTTVLPEKTTQAELLALIEDRLPREEALLLVRRRAESIEEERRRRAAGGCHPGIHRRVAGDPDPPADAHQDHRREDPKDPKLVGGQVSGERFHGVIGGRVLVGGVRRPPR